jgi:ferritin-like metal-binding protein YciE
MAKEKFNSLQDLFEYEIRDLYSAETQLTKALPKMAKAASNEKLRAGFEEHLEQTQNHLKRLERVAELCKFDVKGSTCEAMEGLVAEGEEVIKSKAEESIKDAALVSAAQRVEHYEMAAYGTVRNFAQRLGMDECAKLLEETLNEEKETDSKLNKLAVSHINEAALSA